MVIAYHLIWTVYGAWLPNDPRGSMSCAIRNDLLCELGELHRGRKRFQPGGSEIREFYARAVPLLRHPILLLDSGAVRVVAAAFGEVANSYGYTCYACAIMPDHIHLVIRKHKHLAEAMVANLQRASHLALREAGFRDLEHPVWAGPGWKVFLDSVDDVSRTVRYVRDNPTNARLPSQAWDFVRTYDGWNGTAKRT